MVCGASPAGTLSAAHTLPGDLWTQGIMGTLEHNIQLHLFLSMSTVASNKCKLTMMKLNWTIQDSRKMKLSSFGERNNLYKQTFWEAESRHSFKTSNNWQLSFISDNMAISNGRYLRHTRTLMLGRALRCSACSSDSISPRADPSPHPCFGSVASLNLHHIQENKPREGRFKGSMLGQLSVTSC